MVMNNNTSNNTNNNSGTSSETSDTHSVDDNSTNVIGSRAAKAIGLPTTRLTKSVKRLKDTMSTDKDAEAKRPPWRTVSVSTLPKPDKSALLRAKLLDASRRLRASKNSVAIQTDMEPTKLMKEVSFGPQTDLIIYKDVGMLTDGSYAKKKDGFDKFILTYSVSQMTDYVTSTDMSTQTVLPKVAGDDFIRAYFNSDSEVQVDDTKFSVVERKLLDQIRRIRNSMTDISYKTPVRTSNIDQTTIVPNTVKGQSFPLRSTLNSWHFEYEGFDEINCGSSSYPYVLDVNRSRKMFKPIPLPIALYSNQMDWDLLLLAIDELIQESNNLVDLIEDVTARYYAGTLRTSHRHSSNKMDTFKFAPPELPSNRWLAVVNQHEQTLAEIQNK